jgi:hypothetical protein
MSKADAGVELRDSADVQQRPLPLTESMIYSEAFPANSMRSIPPASPNQNINDSAVTQFRSTESVNPFGGLPGTAATANACNHQRDEQPGQCEEMETDARQQSPAEPRAEGTELRSMQSARRSLRVRHAQQSAEAPQPLDTKRRPSKAIEKSHQKRIKSEQSPEKRAHALLQELEKIDQNIGEPQEIYRQFVDRCATIDTDVACSLVRLFYAIASPQAFDQLREAFQVARTQGEVTIPQKTDTAAQTINALNALNTAAMMHSILRRFHLVRLHQHRAERENQHETDRPARRQTRKSGLLKAKCAKSSSLALADLMAEAYPHLEKPVHVQDAAGTEYGKKYSTLKHMLVAGRNWHALQKSFSIGILALVPTGSECGIQNSE